MDVLKYDSYSTYKQAQVAANKRKLKKIWAIENTIKLVAKLLLDRLGNIKFGLCHGARNGAEVKWFRETLECQVIGTDISDTAHEFDNVIEWDFHELKPEWLEACDFVYSNSLDHSYDPRKALNTWWACLRNGGYLILEWGTGHMYQTESDPFVATLEEYTAMLATFGPVEKFDTDKERHLLLCHKDLSE